MRRTMAVSSQLLSAGVAPPRVRVNLLSSQIDLPKAMTDFRGIIALFLYDQPVPLKPEHILAEKSGPPISLGVFPDNLRPDLEQGALIEFSVAEPPSGLKSWKFRILPPGGRTASAELAPIQQIAGVSAVFHQVYWNGRTKSWGRLFPEGRYGIVLSATDSKGRTNTLHRWLTLRGEKPLAKAQAPKPKVSARPHRKTKAQSAAAHRHLKPKPTAAAQSAQSAPTAPATTPESNASSNAKTSSPAAEASQTKSSQVAPSPASPNRSPDARSAFSYSISFIPNTQTLTQEGEQRLAQAADAMGVYPLANLNVVGHARADETDANALAGNRAKAVSSMLTSKYSVDPKRITLQSKVTDASQPEVEIFIVAGKE
jgi:outer membrane protein OmpA-like peptidoglycan-associated protein